MTARDLKIYPNPNFWLCVHVQGKVKKTVHPLLSNRKSLESSYFRSRGWNGGNMCDLVHSASMFFFL